MKTMKKLLATLLSITMIAVMTACGGNGTGDDNKGGKKDTEEAVSVTEPITIEFWHTLSGDAASTISELIQDFNSTNEYGITVKGTYQGGYYDVLSKVTASYGTDTAPAICVLGAGGIEEIADAGALTDFSAYVERDNYDLENIPKSLRYYMEHEDGQVIEFPFLVSTAVIYYNKSIMKEAPTTLEDWVAKAKAIHAADSSVYGMAMQLDTGYIQRPILKSLGAPGLTSADGNSPATLDDGSLKKYMEDWKSWIDEGFCVGLKVTDTTSQMNSQFTQGKLASTITTSAAITTTYEKLAQEGGFELGVAPAVGYGGKHAAIGGGGLCVLDTVTAQEKAASWEFIKYLLSDDAQIKIHKNSGYIPCTYSSREVEELKIYWEEHPGFKVAAEQLEHATYNEWSPYLSEWRTEIGNCFTAVLVDGSMTADEAISYLEGQATVIFP